MVFKLELLIAVALKLIRWADSFNGGCTPIPRQLIIKSLLTKDLHKTENLYSLADLGQKLISIGMVSFGNRVPNPSFGCTLTNFK